MSNPIESITQTEWLMIADRAWWAPVIGGTVWVGVYLGKRLIDAIIPPGSRFNFTTKWLKVEVKVEKLDDTDSEELPPDEEEPLR